MTIRRRWLLVVSISTVQFCGLMLSIGWFVYWLENHLNDLAAQPDLIRHARLISHIQELTVGVATGMGFVLVVCCTLLNALVVARYESRLARSHADLELLVRRRTDALLRHRDAIIFGLARLADSRDNETGEHLDRIRSYCEVLVRQLARSEPAIDANFVQEVPLASTLHDIGKVGIPDAILLKPGPFSPEERAVMQQHATIGGECLAAIKERLGEDEFIELARQIALAHHERWDGHGYPTGISGEQIPLAARIVALADTYDALTSRRVYKLALDHANARRAILMESGGQFDPRIVAVFLASESEMRQIADATAAERPHAHALSEHGLTLSDWPPIELPLTAELPTVAVAESDLSAQVRRLVESLSLEGERQSASLARLRDECTTCGAIDVLGRPLADSLGDLIQRQVRLSRRLFDIAGKLELQLPRGERQARDPQRDKIGLLHRAAFDNGIVDALQRQVGSEPVALLLIGLHVQPDRDRRAAAGDNGRLMGAVAQFLARVTRRYDLLGRYDEETIAVGMRGTRLNHARAIAERIRSMLATSRFGTEHGDVEFTVHIGGAAAEPGTSQQVLLTRACEALSVARASGRGECCIYAVPPTTTAELATAGV